MDVPEHLFCKPALTVIIVLDAGVDDYWPRILWWTRIGHVSRMLPFQDVKHKTILYLGKKVQKLAYALSLKTAT